MNFRPLGIEGAFLIEAERLDDERGFFARTFCREELAAHGLETGIAQCSVSFNHRRGTLRGLHFQAAPHEEVKLVRCTRGAIFDVLVDLRPSSPSYLQHATVSVTAESRAQVYVPHGVAHGFLTLADETEVFYQISTPYAPESARGYRYDDPAFAIPWPEPMTVISEKDLRLPHFSQSASDVILSEAKDPGGDRVSSLPPDPSLRSG